MKFRTFCAIGIFVCSLYVFLTSFGVNPEALAIHIFGYRTGFNFSHNMWAKIAGFSFVILYIINPFKTKKNA